jgi:hypothetical protein
MSNHLDRRMRWLVGGLLLGLIAFVAPAASTVAGKPNIYRACVSRNGNVRLVFPGRACQRNERLIFWYQVGRPILVDPPGNGTPTGLQGPIGDTGPAGPPGAPGMTGHLGLIGLAGDVGPIGQQGEPGATGATGPSGLQGPIGVTGADGAGGASGVAGPTGATGPAGSGGLSQYAEFYSLMPVDNAATVAVGAAVGFPQDGPHAGDVARIWTGAFVLPNIGTYRVAFSVSVTEAGQLGLALNSTALAYTVCGRATGTSLISEEALVTTTAVNSIISVVNPTGNTTALTITPLAGGATPVAASLVIQQLS